MSNKWKNKNFGEGFNRAVDGIFETIRSEKHMKFHGFITILAIIAALFYNLSKSEAMALSISIAIVWIAELINTAIEACADLYGEEYNELVKKAKDIGAGAVLISAINAFFVGYFIFEDLIRSTLQTSFLALKSSYQHLAVFVMIFISVLVIIIKMHLGKGTALKGGFPSGHSALSGCIFVLINYISRNSKVFFLSFLLMLLVAQSRIEGKIHTFNETLAGVILGIGITYIFILVVL